MKVDEICIDSTTIKFFNDYVVEEENETRKKDLDIVIVNAIKKIIDKK